jgi:Proteasome subunit
VIIDQHPEIWTPQVVVKALQESWSEFRDREIETKILRKHGFSFDSFREQGKDKCSESVYDELHDRIDKFKWSLEFLLAGFDKDGDAHLMGIGTDGTVGSYSELGFWAIGSGSHAALSVLSFHIEHSNLCSYCSCPHNAVYFGCEAKFMAETNVQVGKDGTLVSIHTRNEKEPQFFFNDEVQKIKKNWLKYGAPRPCERVMTQIHDLMQESPSNRSTS